MKDENEPSPAPAAISVLRMSDVRRKLGNAAPSTIYARLDPADPAHDPTFPKPIRLSARSIGWIEHEIDAWIRSRPRVEDYGTPKAAAS